MSWISNNELGGFSISLKNYEDFDEEKSKKYNKHVIQLIEILQDNFSEIEKACKELRYYTLFVKWGSTGFQIAPFLDEIGYFSKVIKDNFDSNVDNLFMYLRDFEKHYFTKLKKEVIEKIENEEG